MNTVLIATEVNEPKRPKAPDKRTGMRKPKLSAFYEERLLRKMEGKSEAEKLKMRKQFDKSKERHAIRLARKMAEPITVEATMAEPMAEPMAELSDQNCLDILQQSHEKSIIKSRPKITAFYEERLLRKMEGKSEAEKLKMRKQFDQSKQRHARRKAKEMMALEKFERIFPDVKQSELLKVSGLNLASMPDPE
jgi:hypothetical protein